VAEQHPITPPPELVQQWHKQEPYVGLLSCAAQWGADQELEACLRLVEIEAGEGAYALARYIRAARRPKPPSLKKQAYGALDTYIYGEPDPKDKERTYNTIRRAIEALPDE
jgi:hypothetical protein